MATLNGVGEVLQNGQHICKVQYRLQQDETPSGQIRISGEVVVIDEVERLSTDVLNAMQSGQLFALRLADNRSIEVSFNRIDPINGIWRVVVGPGNSALM